jgi:hypothetical protein
MKKKNPKKKPVIANKEVIFDDNFAAGIRAEIQIFATGDPDIHPDDARAAITARIRAKAKRREARTVAKIEKIGEDLVLPSLAALRPERWTTEDWTFIRERTENSKSGKPFLKRIMSDRRPRVSEFDRIDIFMLCNWRKWGREVLKWRPALVQFPGLREWRPCAALRLMELARLPLPYPVPRGARDSDDSDNPDNIKGWNRIERWYRGRRSDDNGLKPLKRGGKYFVLDAGYHLTSDKRQWAVRTAD